MAAAEIGRAADPQSARAMLGELAKEDRFEAVQLAVLRHVNCHQKLPRLAPEIPADYPRITASGIKTAWGEPLTIFRYGVGQQYRAHHNAHEGRDYLG